MAKRPILFVALATLCLPLPVRRRHRRLTPRGDTLAIWGDDIGQFNVSAYNTGMMGYRTYNIDKIAQEGSLFTDWRGQQSCTPGCTALITGQSPIRTGLNMKHDGVQALMFDCPKVPARTSCGQA